MIPHNSHGTEKMLELLALTKSQGEFIDSLLVSKRRMLRQSLYWMAAWFLVGLLNGYTWGQS